jgi:hypothetical protein
MIRNAAPGSIHKTPPSSASRVRKKKGTEAATVPGIATVNKRFLMKSHIARLPLDA